jgi:hypothetical protein
VPLKGIPSSAGEVFDKAVLDPRTNGRPIDLYDLPEEPMPRFFFDVMEDGEVTPDNGVGSIAPMLPNIGPLGARPRSGVINFRGAKPGRLWSTLGIKMAIRYLCGRSHDGSPLGTCAGLKRPCRERS